MEHSEIIWSNNTVSKAHWQKQGVIWSNNSLLKMTQLAVAYEDKVKWDTAKQNPTVHIQTNII